MLPSLTYIHTYIQAYVCMYVVRRSVLFCCWFCWCWWRCFWCCSPVRAHHRNFTCNSHGLNFPTQSEEEEAKFNNKATYGRLGQTRAAAAGSRNSSRQPQQQLTQAGRQTDTHKHIHRQHIFLLHSTWSQGRCSLLIGSSPSSQAHTQTNADTSRHTHTHTRASILFRFLFFVLTFFSLSHIFVSTGMQAHRLCKLFQILFHIPSTGYYKYIV